MTGQAIRELRMSEAVWQRKITDACDWLSLRYYFNPDSRRSPAGWPDLAIWGPGGFILSELKAEKGRLSTKQTDTILSLEMAGVTVHLWRPSQWDEVVLPTLRELAVLPREAA